MSHLRAMADAYAEAMLDGLPERWRRTLLNVGAVLGIVAAFISLNAMGALLSGEKALQTDEPLLFADGSLVVPKALPAGGDTADRERRRARGGAQDDSAASTGGQGAAGSDATDIARDVARLVDRETAPGRPPTVPTETVNSLAPPQAVPGPVAVVGPASRVEAPATADPVLDAPPAATPAPAPAPRNQLRLELRSLERVTTRTGDRLQVTLAAVRPDEEADEDDDEHVMSMRVDLPDAGRGNNGESLRLQLAMLPLAPGGDDAPDATSLRVRVTLSDAPVAEPTLARTGADADAASDTLQLWVPLDPPAGATPAPPTEPPAETPPPPASTDTTVPVDVVVPVDEAAAPVPQTVELPPADPNQNGNLPAITVGVDPAPADPAPAPAPAPPAR
jgi:hypothetical protein